MQNAKLRKCIESICSGSKYAETVIVGDFNLPDVSWISGSVNGNAATSI